MPVYVYIYKYNIRIKVKILKVGNLISYKKYKIKILHIDGSILVMSMLPYSIMMRMEYLTLVFFETL